MGREPLRPAELVAAAEGRLAFTLDADPAHPARMEAAARAVEGALEREVAVCGASTGVGASVGRAVPPELRETLARNLVRLHGCGVGPILGEVFAQKPHPGSVRCAAWIRGDLARDAAPAAPRRLQDRYSIRCAPHVIGVLLDALSFAGQLLEIELNGVNDNPLVDPDSGEPVHGGNLYGGHVRFALDGLKAALASVGDLLDRQLVLLCDPATNGGLPENLTGARGAAVSVNHGMKALQITASALAAELQKLTMPASAFSRSTESHNQDKVSMGAIAAREALQAVELVETLIAIDVLAVCQAVDLRGVEAAARGARALHAAVRKSVPVLGDDRPQDRDVAAVLAALRAGEIDPGDEGEASA